MPRPLASLAEGQPVGSPLHGSDREEIAMTQKIEIKKSNCGMCEKLCGVLVHVNGDKIEKIEANREHPLSRGHICQRNRMAMKWLQHPEQLLYPLKRVGERGEGKWQRVTWDDALGEIGEKLKEIRERHGAEALAEIDGTERGFEYWPRGRFMHLFGSPNVVNCVNICSGNQVALHKAICGDPLVFGSDFDNSNCTVLWGTNPPLSWQTWWVHIAKSKRERGMKIITIDPRRTEATEQSDIWLQLRPGTDGALALGWLHVIINEGLYDREFVEKWTLGFDQLKERVQGYPPAEVARITGLVTDDIIRSARMFAAARPACSICYGVATDMIGRNATVVEHARLALRTITGSLDVLGGTLITRPGEKVNGGSFVTEGEMSLLDKLSPEQRRKALGYDVSRLTSWRSFEITAPAIEKVYGVPPQFVMPVVGHQSLLWPAITEERPYPVKALLCNASNVLAWVGPTKKVYEAMKSPNLDLNVVYEFFMTPTAMLADYVLPGASWMERILCTNYLDWGSMVLGGERAIPPLGERRDNYEFFRGLGHAVGQGEYWPWQTQEEVVEGRLKPMGISFKELVERMVLFPSSMVPKFKEKKYETTGFPTRSGKVELYSSVLAELGYDPLPYYEEPAESPVSTPEVAKEYPLILGTGGRRMPFYHSEWMHLGFGSREIHPAPLLDIHPETAQRLGIENGDWAYIETRRGRIKQKANYNAGILPNVVLAQASWWYPEMPACEPELGGVWESNANVLVLDDLDACDRLAGGFQARALLCKVYKA